MEKDKLQDEGSRLNNILNFQDFMLQESKEGKKDTKKTKAIVKKRDEFLDDMRPAAFRLNNNLEGESERFCDEVRAETVGNVLPKLVYVTGRATGKTVKTKK